MNANEMTFGVAIETTAPDTAVTEDGLRIGAYHHGIQVPYLSRGWKAERDGSIDCPGGWKKAGEGASEAERLMGYLAWGAGYAKIHGGRQYGWINGRSFSYRSSCTLQPALSPGAHPSEKSSQPCADDVRRPE